MYAAYNDQIPLEELEKYLRNFNEKSTSNYRRLLCLYDLKKYKD